MPFLIAEYPEAEKPRERLLKNGSQTLSDAELLAILLSTGTRGVSSIDLARRTINFFDGSMSRLAQASCKELEEIKGIGPAKACVIHAAFAISSRYISHQTEKFLQGTVENLGNFIFNLLHTKQQEEFHVILLDIKNRIIFSKMVYRGTLNKITIHPREIFRIAIKEETSKIVLAHNHPSGDPAPSFEDLDCTKNLIKAGKVLDIHIVDHFIIGKKSKHFPKGWVSMRKEKVLSF